MLGKKNRMDTYNIHFSLIHLEYDKNLSPHNFDTSACFEGQSDQEVTQLAIKKFGIS